MSASRDRGPLRGARGLVGGERRGRLGGVEPLRQLAEDAERAPVRVHLADHLEAEDPDAAGQAVVAEVAPLREVGVVLHAHEAQVAARGEGVDPLGERRERPRGLVPVGPGPRGRLPRAEQGQGEKGRQQGAGRAGDHGCGGL